MKVLWFTNIPCGYTSAQGYNGGGWLTSLQQELLHDDTIDLAICFCTDGEPWKTVQNSTTYYSVAHQKKGLWQKIRSRICINDDTCDEVLWPLYEKQFEKVIDDFQPDIIEVFGSEQYTALAMFVANCHSIPCCLHIQGVLSLYYPIYLLPGMSRLDYILSDGIRKASNNLNYLAYWQRSVYREKAVLRATSHVIGRTDWDRQAMEILAPKAQYHYGGEILRPEFYEPSERTLPSTPVIATTISYATYKGFDLILKTARILKEEVGISLTWNVFGNIDPHLAESITGINIKDTDIRLCGVATATQLREALLHSTLYFHSSYIENSSNGIAEAQLLGIPVVATNTGGTQSMVKDGETGLLFPATDPYMAAHRILSLIHDTELNIKLGRQAKAVAIQRHDKETIVNDLLQTYNEIISH